MAKKKDRAKKDDETTLPKFGGFHPLAGGLASFKTKLDAEAQNEEERRKAAGAEAKPPPATRETPASAAARRDAPRLASDEADDDLSFHRMMSGVTPLDRGGGVRLPLTAEVRPGDPKTRAAEIHARAQIEAENALAHLHSLVDDVARFEVSDDGRRVEGRRADTPADLVRSLRRGQLPVDGQLDLHGLHVGQAEDKLVEFLKAMRARKERCVLVIHGKGERVPGSGVLRGEIAAWLSQGKAREHVAAFATAHDEDGGEGAVYVALRR